MYPLYLYIKSKYGEESDGISTLTDQVEIFVFMFNNYFFIHLVLIKKKKTIHTKDPSRINACISSGDEP